MTRPRLLDLFCGAGGAAVGYQRAGFDVTGVDIADQPRYPFTFHQGDALTFDLTGYDAVHASPPCQAYTTMSNRHGSTSPPLIALTRGALTTGIPYVLENVSGALAHMRSPLELTGEMFGLAVHRPRLFESNVLLLAPWRPPRQHDPAAVYGKPDQRRLWTRVDGTEHHAATLEAGAAAMGIDWMTWRELCEAIPPAYTEHIGRQLIGYLS